VARIGTMQRRASLRDSAPTEVANATPAPASELGSLTWSRYSVPESLSCGDRGASGGVPKVMSNTSSSASAWHDYRLRCRWFFAVWLGGRVVVTLLTFLLSLLPVDESLRELPFYVLVSASRPFFVIARYSLRRFTFVSSVDLF